MYYRVRSKTGKAVAFDDNVELNGKEYIDAFCDLSDIDRDKFSVQMLRFDIFSDCPECDTGWIEYDPEECLCEDCGFVPDWIYVARRWRWNPARKRNSSQS